MLSCICSVIDHRRCQNVVRTSVANSAIHSFTTFLFLPHLDIICYQLLNQNTKLKKKIKIQEIASLPHWHYKKLFKVERCQFNQKKCINCKQSTVNPQISTWGAYFKFRRRQGALNQGGPSLIFSKSWPDMIIF